MSGLYGISAAGADALIFIAAYSAGVTLTNAHLVSFGAAAALNYFMTLRPAMSQANRARDPRVYIHLLVVSLAALFLRGGVLSLLSITAGIAPQVAIVAAIAVGSVVLRAGYAHSLTANLWRLGSESGWRTLAYGMILGAAALRLVYFAQVELLPEEAYYWNYARHLDLSYLDHPPMVAWLIRAGTLLFGDTAAGVRLGALCCAVVASLYIYRLTRNLFDERSALVALVLMQLLPFCFFSGLMMTPDAPLTAAWAAALYYLERALVGGQGRAWWGTGIALGLGLISKYTIAMLVPAALLFMVLDPPARRWLWHWRPYAAAALAVVLFAPVVIWNAEHHWASFAFQTARRLAEKPQFALHKLLASALVLLTPAGFVTLPGALRADPTRPEQRRRMRFLQLAVLTPLAVYFVFSLRHEVKLDWTGTVWLGAIPALAGGIGSLAEQVARGARAWGRAAWGPTLQILLLILAGALHYFVLGLPGVGYSAHMEVSPVGWRDLGAQVAVLARQVREQTGSEPLVVGMDRYAIASELAFYGSDRERSVQNTTASHLFGGTGLMYEAWFPLAALQGRTLLLVALAPQDVTGPRVESSATRLDPPREGVLTTRDGQFVHRYYYRVLYGYRSEQQPQWRFQ